MTKLRLRWRALVVVSAALCWANADRADGAAFTYVFNGSDFGSTDFSLAGDAAWVTDPTRNRPNLLRVNPDEVDQLGSAWFNVTQFDPTQNWQVLTLLEINGQGGVTDLGGLVGGDSVSTVLQTQGTGVIAGPEGVVPGPFLSITLDTYQNFVGDSTNSLDIHTPGGQVASFPVPNYGEQENSFVLDAKYSSSNTELTVQLIGAGLPSFQETLSLDMASIFGSEAVHAGVTGWTGVSVENHDVLEFSIAGEPVPEPGTLALGTIGVAGAALWVGGRRRRGRVRSAVGRR